MSKLKELVKKATKGGELLEKGVALAGKPQQMMLKNIAERLGRKVVSDDSTEASAEIVDAVAEKLGVPADSVVGNMAKAGATAALDIFGDPLNLVPVAKVAKMAGRGAKAARKMLEVPKNAEKVNELWKTARKFEKNTPELYEAMKAAKAQSPPVTVTWEDIDRLNRKIQGDKTVNTLNIKPKTYAQLSKEAGAEEIKNIPHFVKSRK
jgi:hypothetical protein